MATGFCASCHAVRPVCRSCGECYVCTAEHDHGPAVCALPYCSRGALSYSAWCSLHFAYLPATEPDDPFPLVECASCAAGEHRCQGILDGCACACTRRRDCRCSPSGQTCVGGGEVLDIALAIAELPDAAA